VYKRQYDRLVAIIFITLTHTTTHTTTNSTTSIIMTITITCTQSNDFTIIINKC